MKALLSILIFLISFTFVSAQIEKVKTTYYLNGQICQRDSIYDCDTIKIVEKYYEKLNNKRTIQICSKGEYLKIGEKSWNQYGHWKYWDNNGKLLKECSFYKGYLKGNYKEYYLNGKIKIEGIYVHIQSVDTNYFVEDLDEPGVYYDYVYSNNEHPVKDGEWKYFNEQGILVRTENYIKGELIK